MARLSVGILSYAEAATFFTNAADRRSRPNGVKIGHNTWLDVRYTTQSFGGIRVPVTHYAIRYHETDIVTILPDDTYILNSGGFQHHTGGNGFNFSARPSSSTKQRINALAPGNLYQQAYGWYLSDGTTFFDGIRIDSTGRVVA